MGYVSKRIIKDIHAYCVDVDPVRVQEAFAQERAELDIEQMRLRKRKQWEKNEYERLRREMFGDQVAEASNMIENTSKPKAEPKPKPEQDPAAVLVKDTKVCAGCGKEKPIFRFRSGWKCQRFLYCTECQARSEREMKAIYKLPKEGRKLHYKKCNRCGLYKDTRNFAYSSTSPDGYRSACKECIRASRRKN